MGNRILIVEDHPDIQEILSIIIKEDYQGVEIVKAKDGDEAVIVLEAGEDFDLIFMDIMMPGMNGLDVVERIKKTSGLKTHVVFFTAVTDQKILQKAKKLGSDVITKPFSMDDIHKILKKYL